MKTSILYNLLIIIFTFFTVSCENYDYRQSYSDCAEALKMRFELKNSDWHYNHCSQWGLSIYRENNKCHIEMLKRVYSDTLTFEQIVSSYGEELKSSGFINIDNEGSTTVSGYSGYFWEGTDDASVFKLVFTYNRGIAYVFHLSAADSLIYNNNIAEFDYFIQSIIFDYFGL